MPTLRLALLAAALATGACATLVDPGPPVLRIHTDSVVATVRDERGRTLGTTPFAARVPARAHQRLVITATGHDSAVVTVGRRPKDDLPTLINPFSWVIDGATGAAWTHDPAILDVTLTPLPASPDSLPDAEAAVVLEVFADAAEDAGCEPLLVGAWRDAAYVLATADSLAPPVPDSVRQIAVEEVALIRPEIAELCARPSPRVDRLREIREAVAPPASDVDDGRDVAAPPLLTPVFFHHDEWEIRDDSVRARLHALGGRLAEAPVTLVVEGYADLGELRHQELGYQRALSVIRALREGGLPADCCVAVSHSGERDDDGRAADVEEARFNRRVTFTLGYAREP